MTKEEDRLLRQRFERIARVKRLLRLMPRRSNVHRYPVLKWSARAARKRSWLWSFRVRYAVPALYAGCILALLPLYGLQLPLSLGLAFLLRANLPILFSLQFITNPLTVLPVYFTAYQIGKAVLNIFRIDTPFLNIGGMRMLIDSIAAAEWSYNINYILTIWSVTFLGGAILGIFLATIASVAYKLAAHEVSVSYHKLKELQTNRRSGEAGQEMRDPSGTREEN